MQVVDSTTLRVERGAGDADAHLPFAVIDFSQPACAPGI
jgi:hypothetical protein